jgi:hypothetical protein
MIPVHFGVSLSTAVFLQRVLPDAIVFFALDPIQYSDGPWIVVRLRITLLIRRMMNLFCANGE